MVKNTALRSMASLVAAGGLVAAFQTTTPVVNAAPSTAGNQIALVHYPANRPTDTDLRLRHHRVHHGHANRACVTVRNVSNFAGKPRGHVRFSIDDRWSRRVELSPDGRKKSTACTRLPDGLRPGRYVVRAVYQPGDSPYLRSSDSDRYIVMRHHRAKHNR